MTYTIVLLVSAIPTIYFSLNKKNIEIIFGAIFLSLITCLLMFRYGVGTDYFAYVYVYDNFANSLAEIINGSFYMEYGYQFLMLLGKLVGLSAEMFIGLIGLITMGLMAYVIFKHSSNILLSLFIYYSVYYLIYCNSAIRQGLSMAIGLIAIMQYIENKKLVRFCLLTVLAILFHNVALLLICVPIIICFEKLFFNSKFVTILTFFAIAGVCFLLGIFILPNIIDFVMVNVFNRPYVCEDYSILSVGMKFVNLLIVSALIFFVKKSDISTKEKRLILIHCAGVWIYLLLCRNQTLSRFIEQFMLLEIFIIPNLLTLIDKKKKIICLSFIMMIIAIVYIKDILSFLQQGLYLENNFFKYNYVSIFNKSDIYNYRSSLY